MRALLIVLVTGILFSCESKGKKRVSPEAKATKVEIIEKPIVYSARRRNLSLEYLSKRHKIYRNEPVIEPSMIVLHYTEGGTFNSIYNYFNSDVIEASRTFNRKYSELNVSSHYLIDRDGKIYHLIPDTLFARHIIGLNYCSIGIENIGAKTNPLTAEQVASNASLVRYLCEKFVIKYLIGHSEYSAFRKTPLWRESDANYYTVKEDPGKEFLRQVRNLLSDLNLKSEPDL